MHIIKNEIAENFEAIFKKILDQFKNFANKQESVERGYTELTDFYNKKNDIEEYEKTINSRTRPLRLGFVGSFSTGKSSMINSLIGEEVLGVKLEPATAQITELSYGDKFEIIEVTEDKESNLDYNEVSLKNYQKNSTSRGNKSANLSHYIIKHPSRNLSKFTIVDTPGFSSTSKEDDELTKKWIETLDLLIWIFDANKVGDKTEYDKLKGLGNDTKVIGVINKIDTKSPSVREKIRNEILNEEFLDDVYFYSSKKVLDEIKKNKSFNDTLDNITSEIKYCVNNSENFEINNTSSEITFKTNKNTKPYSLLPQKTNSYNTYYEAIINKIDNVRENEIQIILNHRLIEKHYEFSNYIKTKLIEYKTLFNKDAIDTSELFLDLWEKELDDAPSVFDKTLSNFTEKFNSSFKVFYTTFFKELTDYLFYKHIDTGIFSDDVYINMHDVDNDKKARRLYEFIDKDFNSFLESCFNIYETILNNSDFKEYSEIEEIRSNKYHIINTIVEGLVSSSVESIIGYQRNFVPDKTESFLDAKEFNKNNIDLIVPDEILQTAIGGLLKDDLDHSYVKYIIYLEDTIQFYQSRKKGDLEIVRMIDKLLEKIN